MTEEQVQLVQAVRILSIHEAQKLCDHLKPDGSTAFTVQRRLYMECRYCGKGNFENQQELAAKIQRLHRLTGCDVVECRDALRACNGDVDRAIRFLF